VLAQCGHELLVAPLLGVLALIREFFELHINIADEPGCIANYSERFVTAAPSAVPRARLHALQPHLPALRDRQRPAWNIISTRING
jgi:hypothetical protein